MPIWFALAALLAAPSLPVLAGEPGVPYLVKDLDPRTVAAADRSVLELPTGFVPLAGGLAFAAIDRDHGRELWWSDGTTTRLLADLDPRPGSGSDPTGLTPLGGRVLCFTQAPGMEHRLWSVGIAGDAVELAAFPLGESWRRPAPAAVGAGRLYFTADDKVHGPEVWVTDGTPGGTHPAAELAPGPGGVEVTSAIFWNGALYVQAVDPPLSRAGRLWRIDGDRATPLCPESTGVMGLFYGGAMAPLGDRLFFFHTGQGSGESLWSTNGTPGGTRLEHRLSDEGDFGLVDKAITNAGGRLFVGCDFGVFTLSEPGGTVRYLPHPWWCGWAGTFDGRALLASSNELWISDGTDAGTRPLGRGQFAAVDDRAVYLVGDDAAPTLSRLRPGADHAEPLNGPAPSYTAWSMLDHPGLPVDRTAGALGGTLLGAAFRPGATALIAAPLDAAASAEVFRFSAEGPADGAIHGLAAVPGGVVFLAREPGGRTGLFRSDGTGRGTAPIAVYDDDPEMLGDGSVWTIGGAVFFFATEDGRTALHRTDGTSVGTRVIDLTTPGGVPALPYMDYRWRPTALFIAREARTDLERRWLARLDPATGSVRWLRMIDEVVASTQQVRGDLHLLTSWSSPAAYVDAEGVETPVELPERCVEAGWATAAGGRVYFAAAVDADGAWSYDLWASDGPGAPPRRVSDFHTARGFTVLPAGDRVIVILDRGEGEEVWSTRTDGAGMVGPAAFPSFDYWNGPRSAGVGGVGAFVPLDAASGREVWRAGDDGLTLLAQTIPGPDGDASRLRTLGDLLAFQAATAAGGPELWLSDGTAAGTRSLSAWTRSGRPLDGREAVISGGTLFLTGRAAETGEELWAVRLCAADFNGDGAADAADWAAFTGLFEAGDTAAEMNGDGFLDFFDYDRFLAALESGC